MCATTATADAVVTPSVDVDRGGGGDANRSDNPRGHLCERRRGSGVRPRESIFSFVRVKLLLAEASVLLKANGSNIIIF